MLIILVVRGGSQLMRDHEDPRNRYRIQTLNWKKRLCLFLEKLLEFYILSIINFFNFFINCLYHYFILGNISLVYLSSNHSLLSQLFFLKLIEQRKRRQRIDLPRHHIIHERKGCASFQKELAFHHRNSRSVKLNFPEVSVSVSRRPIDMELSIFKR